MALLSALSAVVSLGPYAVPAIKTAISIAKRVLDKSKAAAESDALVRRSREKVEILASLLAQLEGQPTAKQRFAPFMQMAQQAFEEQSRLTTQCSDESWLRKFFKASEVKGRMEKLESDLVHLHTQLTIILGSASFTAAEIQRLIQEEQERARKELDAALDADPRFARAAEDEEERVAGQRAVSELQLRRGQNAYEAEGIMPAGFLGRFKVVSRELLLAELGERQRLADSSGQTYALLHQAVFWNSLYGVLLLLDNKADINIQTQAADPRLEIPRGSTPLHFAVVTLNVDIVRVLLSRGADPEAKNSDGKTPKQLASGFEEMQALFANVAELKTDIAPNVAGYARDGKWLEMFTLINERGANPNMKHPHARYYALHQAAYHGNLDVCVQLVCAGALPTLRTVYSSDEPPKLPSEVAKGKGHVDCARVLQDIEEEAEARMAGTEEPPRGRRR